MIHISDAARKIESFLLSKEEKVFKIFIRINFNIDVFVFTTNNHSAFGYQQEFFDSLKDTEDEYSSYYQKNKDLLKIKFNIVDLDEAEYDPYYTNILENAYENHIDLGPRYRFNSILQKNNIVTRKRDIPIVTFYSYKGGMGRTTTMIAYALSLAANADEQKRKRVVIIDCDLEAPGYLNFFDLSKHNGLRSGRKNGLVEFISDAQFTNKPEDLDINDYIINVGLDNENNFAYNNLDNIWIVPAGNLNEGYTDLQCGTDRNDYLEGLAKINLSSVQSVIQYFNLLFDKIKEAIKPDIILIDSRTGFNDIFGTAALYLSSCVVGFFGFSRQTQPGLINLLKEYYNANNNFKLRLVYSIIPENASEEWLENQKKNIKEYIYSIDTESKDAPTFLDLHRNTLLEKIGTGDELSDSEFVKLVQENKFADYNTLFKNINELFFKEDDFSSKTPTNKLRIIVLKHLKNALSNVSNFAEDIEEIEEKQFFYRKCMKELFNPKKFIIQGYKGTGKTYLYKSLADKEIAHNIQRWALDDEEKYIDEEVLISKDNILDPIYIHILPPDETSFVFNDIYYSGIEEPEYYFNAFWQIYTWNMLLLRPEFESIKNTSELCDFIEPISGKGYAKKALIRIDELISKGIKALIIIENDILKINNYLKINNQRLFVLYDRLDTCINPLRWNKAVSPLINYWRDNCESFSNIVPKIFIRTDLFKQIEGTNTARLENNIIRIEWSITEVFGFFFKLIFTNEQASNAYWAIAKKVGIPHQYIESTKKSFNKFPYNQFKSSSLGEMSPIIRVFFGHYVKVGEKVLGTPEQYFERELSNADNTAISLRPFINTMDSNAVDKALGDNNNVFNCILSPEIYASKSVRETTTEKYFADLTQDAFSKDLSRFKEVIRTSIGEPYRFKALNEVQFEELITMTFDRITDSDVVRTPEDLKRLIFANGIMAEKITRIGRFYRFAPIYWYSWGLANSVLEKEETLRKRQKKLVENEEYCGIIIVDHRGKKRIKCPNPYFPEVSIRGKDSNKFSEGDEVEFIAKRDVNRYDSSKIYWYTTNVRAKKDYQ